ncbi:MAG: MFS transporter [Deferrisomatales bacterium]
MDRGSRRGVVAWALYDWANSAFATTVMAGFFPVFFKAYWSAGADPTRSTFQLGAANSLASAAVVLAAPVLGAVADRGGAKKRFLALFAALGIATTGALFLVGQGRWLAAAALYAVATVGFSGGNIFYDALLVDVAPEDRVDFVSALGFALGYLGGGLLFALNVAMTQWPGAFGLADAGQAVRVSFVTVAGWWALFSIPLALWVRERAPARPSRGWTAWKEGFGQLAATFRKARQLRQVFLFLVGYWLYIDGVDTIVRMAVDYGLSLGFAPGDLIRALLLTQFVGFPAAILFGKLGERIGAKAGILVGIGVYVGVTAWGYQMSQAWEFYALAATIGLVQGGVQALSRSFYARLVPPGQAAEFFGFYNMLGKFAAVLGPVLMGWVGVVTGNPRAAIFAVTALLLAGAACLWRVDEEAGRRAAREL